MTNDRKSGPPEPEDREPLSATAMFMRSLDEAATQKPEGGPEVRPLGMPQSLAEPGPQFGPLPSSQPGEFTQIFGSANRPPAPSVPLAAAQPAPASRPEEQSGEFTRIFLKETGVPPSRADELLPRKNESSSRAKGFSSPGVSDAASGDSTFANFFKPNPAAATQPPSAKPAGSPLLGAELNNPHRPPDAPSRFSGVVPPSSDRSVTDILSHLAADRSTSLGQRNAEVVPYREEPRRDSPLSPLSQAPAADPGGVTQILNRLAPEPVRSVIESAPVRIEPAPTAGPGEFTRMISREEVNAARGIPPPAQPAPAPSAPAFAPPAPPLPKLQPPPAARIPVIPAPAALPVAPAMPAAAAPAPPKLPVPIPAPAPPKTRFEAMVPFLLLVNTFLLVVLLVVVVFLVKTR